MGKLDGLKVLRYGHVYDSGGGMEQYLVDLNRALRLRNRFTTIQVQLTSDRGRVGEFEEPASQGTHWRVSRYVSQQSHESAIQGSARENAVSGTLKKHLARDVLSAPVVFPLFTGPLLRRFPKRRAGEPEDPGELIDALHARHRIDLIILHYAGGSDSARILARARRHGIPATYIHHFSNDRLASISLRAQIESLPVLAGVCNVDVPPRFQDRFVNVSDGIDTEFYRREKARTISAEPNRPIIFLPARITPAKGQQDLVRAAGKLKRAGLDFRLVLAGRVESEAFMRDLEQLIVSENIHDRVEFVGQLGPQDLRDWYGVATVMAFPTHHNEGLGRITIEAQSMMTPAVVNEIGGTPESLINGKSGYLVGVGDIDALTLRLSQLLRSAEMRESMAQAGRKFVEERFSLESLAIRHEEFYLRVLSAAK